MALRIQRKSDNRVVKCILHKVADIPGGVGVETKTLGGNVLYEGTPLGVGKNGLYCVVKTVEILKQVETSATQLEVKKGHHFVAGDYIATDKCVGQKIKSIDKSDAAKDIITLEKTLNSSGAIEVGTCAFESAESSTDLKVTPVIISGSDENVEPSENLFTSAWVMAVIRRGNAPIVNGAIEKALKCVSYV